MFDVSWSDPNRETVGQRKSRREQDQNTVTPGIQRTASTSSSSTTTKHRPTILKLFNGSRKDFSGPAYRKHVSMQHSEEGPPQTRDGQAGEAIFSFQELPPGTLKPDVVLDRFVATEMQEIEQSGDHNPPDGPAFAMWASRSASTDSTWSSPTDSPRKSNFVQPLSPTSFVTQRTEITVSSRDGVSESEQHGTIVRIFTEGKAPSGSPDIPPQLSPSSSISELRVPELYPLEKAADLSWLEGVLPRPSDKCTIGNEIGNNRWKVPENWECPTIPIPPKSSARLPWRANEDENSLPGSNIFQVQKSLRRMRTASPKIMLERLTEDWVDPADPTFEEELKFEKQLWMRTALHACIQKSMNEGDVEGRNIALNAVPTSPTATKVCSLYHDHASLCHLSTLDPSPTTEIHHLTATATALLLPSSPSSNIYTLTVPSPTASLPYGPHLFASIHASLALPSLLPSSALPPLLRECYRVLRMRGTLHLTLVDPCPVSATMGPRMREWLDTHLCLELERTFRCGSPVRLVPEWCVAAGFGAASAGGEGAGAARRQVGIRRLLFAAVALETAGGTSRPSSRGRSIEGRIEVTWDELQAIVGRRLWEGCWGRFCVDGGADAAARRWWEDKEVMEECARMGTMWEILVVEALKEE